MKTYHMMKKSTTLQLALTLTMSFQVMQVQAATDAELDSKANAVIKRDFHDKGIAKTERLNQDKVQALCTKYLESPPVEDQEALEAEQEKTIQWPADGKYMGNWQAGETLAQSGSGMTWSDKPGSVNGGNCYNCHQLSAKEIAYGTIGPSLLHFRAHLSQTRSAKMRSPEALQRYAYGHIYNDKAYNLCSNMPRFGHIGILTEAQIKDLVALLLDPESPVNKE
jgi:L-cysteine S-thiosulfotransferase